MKDIIEKSNYEPSHRSKSWLIPIIGAGIIVGVLGFNKHSDNVQAKEDAKIAQLDARRKSDSIFNSHVIESNGDYAIRVEYMHNRPVIVRDEVTHNFNRYQLYTFKNWERKLLYFLKDENVVDSLEESQKYDLVFNKVDLENNLVDHIEGSITHYRHRDW